MLRHTQGTAINVLIREWELNMEMGRFFSSARAFQRGI
jgi:hypothetical protein